MQSIHQSTYAGLQSNYKVVRLLPEHCLVYGSVLPVKYNSEP